MGKVNTANLLIFLWPKKPQLEHTSTKTKATVNKRSKRSWFAANLKNSADSVVEFLSVGHPNNKSLWKQLLPYYCLSFVFHRLAKILKRKS